MGLFNKKKEQVAEDTSNTLTVENTEVTDVKNMERFSVIVEGVTTMLDGDGFIATGLLSGKLKTGDKVYVYQPGKQAVESKVIGIEAKTEDRTSIVEEAADTAVALQLDLEAGTDIRRFAVLTNLGPQEKAGGRVSIPNATLAGLINGMTKYGGDNNFLATIAYWLSHSTFITPIKMDQAPELNEKGMAVITKDSKVGFYILQFKDKMVMPLFTDWSSLQNFKDLGKDGKKVYTQIIPFQQLYAMLKKGSTYTGIAINGFNKVPCILPIEYLDKVVNTPGYQSEFGAKAE